MLRTIALLIMAKAAKEGADNGGGATAELGLKGAGAEAVTIEELDEALADYKPKRDARIAASKLEIEAKDKVIALFHKHAEQLQDGKGVLRYKYHDEDDDSITKKPWFWVAVGGAAAAAVVIVIVATSGGGSDWANAPEVRQSGLGAGVIQW